MKIVQINNVLNTGSTGRITEQVGEAAIKRGHTSFIAYGRDRQKSESESYRIGGLPDLISHGVESFLFDRQGLGSRQATMQLIKWLEAIKPDAIGLHNIHGYYLNFPIFFGYLKRFNIPVVWTLHDCWSFTGHCSYFDRFDCTKWEDECNNCPMTGYYPKSVMDNSRKNYLLKKRTFCGHPNLLLVTPSKWLRQLVGRSFLSSYPVRVINNGIDLEVFKPIEYAGTEKIILGVAGAWDDRKGLRDFLELRSRVPASWRIVLIGVTRAQQWSLPRGIEGIVRTENLDELVAWYQKATVFVNPTYSDNFPTTNVEALGCGVPVVTYETGGSPESLDGQTGQVVRQGDVEELAKAILSVVERGRQKQRVDCRKRAELLFNKTERFAEYIDTYESLVSSSVHSAN